VPAVQQMSLLWNALVFIIYCTIVTIDPEEEKNDSSVKVMKYIKFSCSTSSTNYKVWRERDKKKVLLDQSVEANTKA
jgi:hypothetical protein